MRLGLISAYSIQMDARDRAYYLRRIVQEQEAAKMAVCREARERHDELAAAYRLRCQIDPSRALTRKMEQPQQTCAAEAPTMAAAL